MDVGMPPGRTADPNHEKQNGSEMKLAWNSLAATGTGLFTQARSRDFPFFRELRLPIEPLVVRTPAPVTIRIKDRRPAPLAAQGRSLPPIALIPSR